MKIEVSLSQKLGDEGEEVIVSLSAGGYVSAGGPNCLQVRGVHLAQFRRIAAVVERLARQAEVARDALQDA